MNVTIENVAPCRKTLRIDIDAQVVDETYRDLANELQRQVRLPGFRPGKAPKALVEKSFAKELEDQVKRKLLKDSYTQALKEHKLHVVGAPEVETLQFGRGQQMQLVLTIETAPEFELPEYKGLPAKKEKRSVSEEDVDRALGVLRERMVNYNDVDRPAGEGDMVVVNYTGTCEGKPLTEIAPSARGLTHQENFWMEIKPGHFIPGFTEQLVGASKGEKRTVEVDFPQDFVAQALSGKHGTYEVEIVQVKEKILPELDDKFAVDWGAESLEKLREGVRKDLENELEVSTRRHVRNQVVQALSERVQCDLPESVVMGETRNLIYDIVVENQRRGIDKEHIDQKKEEIFNYANTNAKEKVKIAFVLGRIAEKEGIKVSQEELAARIYSMAEQKQVKPEKLIKELRENDQLQQVHEQILLGKVVDFLEANAQIEEVEPQPAPAQS